MKTSSVFTASQFTPTQWDSADQKAKFANHFVRFVESGFKRALFHKWFYTRLSGTFGHIAHYDIHGFYAEWFADTGSQLAFLARTRSEGAFGSPTWTYSDVELALRQWVQDSGLIAQYAQKASAEVEAAERAHLAALKAKYEGAQ